MKYLYLYQITIVGLISFVLALFCLTSGLYTAGSQANAAPNLQRSAAFDRPDPDGVPTKVYIGLFLLDIISIDDVHQSFTADFFAIMRWSDPRLALDEPSTAHTLRHFDFEEIWHPMAYVINQRELSRQLERNLRVDPAGNVQYVQRFVGEFSALLNLKDFPLDQQKLALQIVSFRYGPEEVAFVNDKQRTGRRETFSLVGWSIEKFQPELTTEYLEVQDRHLARVDYTLDVKRRKPFYIIKAMIPLFLILCMAWSVFFIDPSVIGPQIAIPTSSVFALILQNHRISTLLPRVSYLTRLDRFILLSIILVFITLGESVMTAMLAHKGNKVLALKIDRLARYLYLCLFAAFVIYSFVL